MNSENKRRSAGNTVPLVIFPIPDGTIDDFDREQATWMYGGLGAGAVAVIPPVIPPVAVANVLGGGLFTRRAKRVPILAMRDMTEEDEELMVLL